VEGDAAAVGKATGKDAAAGKATFVSLRGITGAHSLLEDVTAQAQEALRPFRDKGAVLSALLAFNQGRIS
jgi:farnesyl diphosphate synthase